MKTTETSDSIERFKTAHIPEAQLQIPTRTYLRHRSADQPQSPDQAMSSLQYVAVTFLYDEIKPSLNFNMCGYISKKDSHNNCYTLPYIIR